MHWSSWGGPGGRARTSVGVLGLLAAVGLLSTGCASVTGTAAGPRPSTPGTSVGPSGAEGTVLAPRLASVIATGHMTGGLSPSYLLHLSVGLKGRDPAGLDRLLASGKTVTPAQYSREFGPGPAAVGVLEHWLRSHGLRTSWSPGDVVLPVVGSAADVQRAFSVTISRYQAQAPGRGEVGFYAPASRPELPEAFLGVVSSVVGLDDYPVSVGPGVDDDVSNADVSNADVSNADVSNADVSNDNCGPVGSPQDEGDFTPSEVASFYNFNPLYKAGINGTGQTVVFIETDGFLSSDIDSYSAGFNLPAPNIVGPVTNQSWGTPGGVSCGGSETDLDLEVVHAMAPQARMVVYEAGTGNTLASVWAPVIDSTQSAVDSYPHAVFNISQGLCEEQGSAQQWESVFQKLNATGGTVFVSSGDSGAYAKLCATANHSISVQEPGDAPNAVSVGGTTALIGQNGAYGEEATWGGAYEQWGAGGGVSSIFARPSWQTGPGVSNQYSTGKRQIPDVSAIADSNTGWDTFGDGTWGATGGTSAAAPLWAALAVLTNEALGQRKLGQIGDVNPALYDIGANESHFPAQAFHPVTHGNNLYYQATSTGWNYGTGWGTPNAAGVVDDLISYAKGKR